MECIYLSASRQNFWRLFSLEGCLGYSFNWNKRNESGKNLPKSIIITTWKESKYRVFSGPYFPAFRLNTERECGKIRTRKKCVFGHFSRSVFIPFEIWLFLWYFFRILGDVVLPTMRFAATGPFETSVPVLVQYTLKTISLAIRWTCTCIQ